MPQMMPINWMISFIFFILIFILFNMLNYFIYKLKLNNKNLSSNKKMLKNFNWKW